jgi:hypothetical protein
MVTPGVLDLSWLIFYLVINLTLFLKLVLSLQRTNLSKGFFFFGNHLHVCKVLIDYVVPTKKEIVFWCSALSKFVNKAADGGITALHMAALNGLFDCVQLLLDLEANVSAVTFHYGTSMDMIGLSFLSAFFFID